MTNLLNLPPAGSLSDDQVAKIRSELVGTIGSGSLDHVTTGHRWAWLSGGIAAAAAAIFVVSSVLSAPGAYASWTATPSPLASSETQSLGTACADRVRARFPDASPHLQPVVAERRGDFKTALIADLAQVAVCADWIGPISGNTQRGSTLEGLTTAAALPPGQVVSLVAVPGQLGGPDALRMAYGLVASTVARVVVQTTDGHTVTASVDHGYFLAWWPTGSEIRTITAHDAAGRTLARVPG